jgi:glycosyltransferase involved in cell wall biosynthesis
MKSSRLRSDGAPAAGSETAAGLRVAVLVPCYNEAQAIAKVVRDFRAALPEAVVYVYDNNSSDGSAGIAGAAGAVVRHEPRQGKGIVMRRMFADIEADIFLMVDGDDTYEAAAAPRMVRRMLEDGLDMVNGVRIPVSSGVYRPGHAFGNRMLTAIVRVLFGHGHSDMLSGYRVLSRRFVKSFPVMSTGFEIETELTIHALELQMPSAEERTAFKDRPEGSESKLRSFADGLRILRTITRLLKQERPVEFFGAFGALFALLALVLAYPVLVEYYETGLVPRLPTAVLSASLMLLAFLSIACGLILDTVTRGRQEAKRMRYLAEPGIMSVVEGRSGRPQNLAAATAE